MVEDVIYGDPRFAVPPAGGDVYSRAVDFFMAFPGWGLRSELTHAWRNTDDAEGGVLFLFAGAYRRMGGTDGITPVELDRGECGCLTMIRERPDFRFCGVPAFQDAIVGDLRIPVAVDALPNMAEEQRHESLLAFAEWQRRLDSAIPNRFPKGTTFVDVPDPEEET